MRVFCVLSLTYMTSSLSSLACKAGVHSSLMRREALCMLCAGMRTGRWKDCARPICRSMLVLSQAWGLHPRRQPTRSSPLAHRHACASEGWHAG